VTDLLPDLAGLLRLVLLKVPALVIAVTVHELAHGIVADRLGDPTPRRAGRLTLNPLPHIDPFGALAFVVAGFGWAKPVPVTAANLRRPASGMVVVAVAGPVANFVAAFAALSAVVWTRGWTGRGDGPDTIGTMLLIVFEFNVALGIFNLIPIPPLDGGHVLQWLVPSRHAARLGLLTAYGPLLLLALVVSGATRSIIGPVFEVVVDAYVTFVRFML
jgi:Zn-dependent protease